MTKKLTPGQRLKTPGHSSRKKKKVKEFKRQSNLEQQNLSNLLGLEPSGPIGPFIPSKKSETLPHLYISPSQLQNGCPNCGCFMREVNAYPLSVMFSEGTETERKMTLMKCPTCGFEKKSKVEGEIE